MVSLTDSELDCVMNAARPLDVSARDAFLRERRARWRAAPRSATAWCTGSSPRFSVDIFCRPNLTTEKPRRSGGIWLESSPYSQERHGSTRFVAEAEKFRTRSLGERAREPQERETS
jgi:hypothetical protein